MLTIIWNIAAFILALGILVTIHEYGHYWVAKKCGVKVERFSVGFGKVLWSKTNAEGTEFVLSMIPLGGYVKMLDERVADVLPEEREQAFNNKSVYKRFAIIAAGPGANFVLAVAALWLIFLFGVPSVKPVVGSLVEGSAAAQAQLPTDQQIVSIGDRKVADWQQVSYEIISHIGDKQLIIVTKPVNGTTTQSTTLMLDDWTFDPDKHSPLTSIGIRPLQPKVDMELAFVGKDSAAEYAGLKVGDKILSANGLKITEWNQLVKLIENHPEQNIETEINRGGELLRLSVTPKARTLQNGEQKGYLGVSPKVHPWPEHLVFEQHYGFFGSLSAAIERTWRYVVLSFDMLGKLLTGDVSVKSLSGPISIAQGAGTTAGYGLVYFLGFLALISVNLGVINLLPLPVLDGGHLAYFTVEMITGKPVPENIQEFGYKIGAMLLLAFMGIAIFNDISRL